MFSGLFLESLDPGLQEGDEAGEKMCSGPHFQVISPWTSFRGHAWRRLLAPSRFHGAGHLLL